MTPKLADTLRKIRLALVGGLNLYRYANGNPINRIDPTGEFGLIGAGIGAGLDLALQLIENGGNLKCVNWTSVAVSGAMGAFTGGFASATRSGVKGVTTVSRWGREGLKANDWVMEGAPNLSNYIRSFKWDFLSPTNKVVGYRKGQHFVDIPSNSLKYPTPFFMSIDGGWKGLMFGQKIYAPNSLGIPAWKLDLAKNATGMVGTGAIKKEQGIGNPICGCQ